MRTVYIANDGTEFGAQSECEAYENNYAEELKRAYADRVLYCGEGYSILGEGFEGLDYEVVRIANEEDRDAVNKYVYHKCHTEIVQTTDIGKDVIIGWGYDNDCAWCLGDVYDVMHRTLETYNKLKETWEI